jgi:hypothetical protein
MRNELPSPHRAANCKGFDIIQSTFPSPIAVNIAGDRTSIQNGFVLAIAGSFKCETINRGT